MEERRSSRRPNEGETREVDDNFACEIPRKNPSLQKENLLHKIYTIAIWIGYEYFWGLWSTYEE